MRKTATVAACQPRDVHGDIEETLRTIEVYAAKAEKQDADLICFPECYLQGYVVNEKKTRELALDLSSHAFKKVLNRLSEFSPVLIIGLIEIENEKLYNTAVVVKEEELLGVYRKINLYGGENGVFESGSSYPVFEDNGFRFGINICYDLNFSESAQAVARQDADLLVCPCNNMMRYQNAEKWKYRHNEIRARRTLETGLWLVSSDVTGEKDGRISYGPTAMINPKGSVVEQVPLLKEGMLVQKIVF